MGDSGVERQTETQQPKTATIRKVPQQRHLRDLQPNHPVAEELHEISKLLDSMPEVMARVRSDLVDGVENPGLGRRGMTALEVVRAFVLKTIRGLSYRALAFQLIDSQSARAFCRVPLGKKPPSVSALQANICKVRPETIRAINEALVQRARSERIDYGSRVAIDCTVIAHHLLATGEKPPDGGAS